MEVVILDGHTIIKSRNKEALLKMQAEQISKGRIANFGEYPLGDGRWSLVVTQVF